MVRKQIFLWKEIWGLKLGVAGKWTWVVIMLSIQVMLKTRCLELSVVMICWGECLKHLYFEKSKTRLQLEACK